VAALGALPIVPAIRIAPAVTGWRGRFAVQTEPGFRNRGTLAAVLQRKAAVQFFDGCGLVKNVWHRRYP